MTKEEFRNMATAAIDSLMRVPDDLWGAVVPMVRIHIKGSREVVLVGVVEEGDDDEDREEDDC